MAVYRHIDQLNIEQSIVTIGSFDGVHSGHRALLRRLVELSEQYDRRSVVVTFWPHPRQVLDAAEDVPMLLNTFDEKVALLTQTGVDDILVIPFDHALSQMPAIDFVRDVIVGKLHAHYLVVGQDHHFGKERGGDAYNLSTFTADSDMQIEVVDLKRLEQKISSSLIRKALLNGDVASANHMLGYEYMMSGKVIHGNHLGRTLGFPTANIEIPPYKLIPQEGVYRVKVAMGGIRSDASFPEFSRFGMMYIGKRPVLRRPDETQHIEVNVFDFDEQIYGQQVTFALTHRIRNDIKFDNMEQLAMQLARDKQEILNIP